MDFQKKADYSGKILSCIHAVIAVIFSVIGCLYMW